MAKDIRLTESKERIEVMNETGELSSADRIWLHLRCPCKNWEQARFHIAGILREFDSLVS
ncbi:MAG: hypothetical protein CMO55_20025 [Verrucomicrobiales bacterium]|nr:hypothetical protein [Verrucomicrobiales bacterium]